MIERPRRVVLLIDYDNLQICASRDTPGRDLQLTPVVQLAQRYGTVILARAYAEWNLSTERLAVYKAGIEPAFAPVLRTESDRSGKSLADTVMVAEGMDMLWTLSPEVVVLATSDKDLIPLVRVAKQRGAFVVVLGSDYTAIPLREMADDHFTYRQLITDASGRFATEGGPGRQPAALPEPTRRRARERNGRERAGSTVPASSAVSPSIPPRPERAERPEREAPPAAAASGAAAFAPTASVAEPVAAVAVGDADSQVGGRRRRRRGSRRRSERVGPTGEGISSGEGASDGGEVGELDETENAAEEEALPITPAASLVEVAEASSGTVEMPPLSEIQPATPTEISEPVAAPPRDRRRRARRVVTGSGEGMAADAGGASPGPAPAVESSPLAPELPLAVEEPEPRPEPIEGATTPDGEEPPKPRARPRRVASATRGRSRR
jgi:uncharacterized LabA/DUF88 family protein